MNYRMQYGLIGVMMCGVAPAFADQFSSVVVPHGVLLQAGLLPDVIARCALFLGILLFWTILSGKLLRSVVHMPIIAGQIVGGILLGPSGADIAQWSFFAHALQLVDRVSAQVYTVYASDLFSFFIFMVSSVMTVSYLMWIAGHETDLRDIAKVGFTAVNAGILGAIIPIIGMMMLSRMGLCADWSLLSATGFGLVMSATSVSIPVAMLFAYNKMHLKSSKVTLGAAVIDDVFAVILVSLYFIAISAGFFGTQHCVVLPDHCQSLAVALSYMVIGFVAMLGGGYLIIPRLVNWLQRSQLGYLIEPLAQCVMWFFFAFAELFGGLAGITGSYFAGLFHRMGDRRHRAEKVFSPYVNKILLPLFLGSIGLQVNVGVLTMNDWLFVGMVLLVAIVSKIIGCYMATMMSNLVYADADKKWSFWESFLFGSSMVARGEVGLVIATLLYGAQAMNEQQYVIAIVVIVLTTVVAPIMLSIGFSQLNNEKQVASPTNVQTNIGKFNTIGTTQLYHIILGSLTQSGHVNTTVSMSEGRKVAHLQEYRIKVILCPEEGILFEGDRHTIETVLAEVKDAIDTELHRLSF